MKKSTKATIITLISFSYAVILSLLDACLLNDLSMRVALFGGPSIFPRFSVFCIVLGVLAFAALVVAIILNIRFSNKINYTRFSLSTQIAVSLILSFAIIPVWLDIFDRFHAVF